MEHSATRIMNSFTLCAVVNAEHYQSCPKRIKQHNERFCSMFEFDLQPEQNATVILSQLKWGE